jgi:hypothetical protein
LSQTLRKEHKLRVFENSVLRRILAPKRDEVTEVGENCIIRRFMIFSFAKYNLNDQINKDKTFRLLAGKPEEMRPIGEPGLRWVNNIKMDLGEIV